MYIKLKKQVIKDETVIAEHRFIVHYQHQGWLLSPYGFTRCQADDY